MKYNTNPTTDKAHCTIRLGDAFVTCYMAYRPCEGPDGSDWAARFDLAAPDGGTEYGWKADHAIAFLRELSPTGDALAAVQALELASRSLMKANLLAR